MISTFCERSNAVWRMLWRGALLLFVVGICQPKQALAQFQQWQGPDANHPINNANIPNNVGIGITNPTATLHVVGTTNPGFLLDAYGQGANFRFRRADGTASMPTQVLSGEVLGNISFSGFGTPSGFPLNASSKITATASENWTDSTQGSQLGFYTTPTGSAPGGGILRMSIDNSGAVGVGGLSGYPLGPYVLDVNGFFHTTFNSGVSGSLPATTAWGGLAVGWNRSNANAEVNFYNVYNSGIATAFQFSKMVNATTVSDLMTILGNGSVGIGTTNPTSLLHVAGSITGTSLNTSGNGPINSGTGTITSGSITSSGNITALSGTIQGNNVIANYQDVAEWVPASAKMPAGTVVVIDAQVNNHVLPCSTAYDTRVAGVISANPGVILGQRDEGKVMVATTGRVRVRVDATRAPIRVGDLLVTSDKEGVAMRSMPVDLGGTPIHRPGTLIGKALEPLASGTGEILVLLSLQ
jgi:hypothetical protein